MKRASGSTRWIRAHLPHVAGRLVAVAALALALGVESCRRRGSRRPRSPGRAREIFARSSSASRWKSPQRLWSIARSAASSPVCCERSNALISFGTQCVSPGIATSGWESSISRSSVVPERVTPQTNGAGAGSGARPRRRRPGAHDREPLAVLVDLVVEAHEALQATRSRPFPTVRRSPPPSPSSGARSRARARAPAASSRAQPVVGEALDRAPQLADVGVERRDPRLRRPVLGRGDEQRRSRRRGSPRSSAARRW